MARVLFICSMIVAVIYSALAKDVSSIHNHTAFSGIANGENMKFRQNVNSKEEEITPKVTTAQPPQECVCSKIYDPICASNDKSYFNLCQMECDVGKGDNVTVVHQGNCIPF